MSPVLAGRFFTIEPPGKPTMNTSDHSCSLVCNMSLIPIDLIHCAKTHIHLPTSKYMLLSL